MHPFWLFFLQKRQFTWLLMLALIAAGAYTVYLIPKESAPEVIVPIAIVTTVYPGASAADVEELITNKLESNFENLDNLKQQTSVSRDGISSITVEFNANADVDESVDLVKDAVDLTKPELPSEVDEPRVMELNFANQPIHVLSISSDLDPVSFTQLGEDLQDEFKKVGGVSSVEVSGTRGREIQVVVDSASLATHNLSIGEVVGALASANISVPIGTVLTDGVEYSIKFEGEIESIDAIRTIPVKSANGFPVFIGDIATVTDGVGPESSISRVSVDGS
ncbi:MAG TPA: efflux RND transporter permease subunit, partial [Candidatus Paceibacterota bacterium]